MKTLILLWMLMPWVHVKIPAPKPPTTFLYDQTVWDEVVQKLAREHRIDGVCNLPCVCVYWFGTNDGPQSAKEK